ncbi:ral-GDS-related protein-like [Manis pentadactyla]|uniref:ral-GDS-related protein-like n=1 Tax=Manis pentadactyla TaxID=143292 RepID=UPI00255C4FCA|nr:ral-GDS-related protein-like [Manis pentadactyla]XP_057357895.1 ral-GDS-related protein-like [Manis pentadactyla]XP_057357896.1 ral-GDS-related protein-like [Manis pentadactyla]XP_057357897.1 ral-GDS-related protein-like [Manis pentadactyla]
MVSSCDEGHDEGPEEDLRIPRMGRARRLAWEPQRVPSVIDASQLSSTLVGRVLHHLVQEEHLGPAVAELEDPRQRQLAPETQGGPASWVEPVQELPATPVLELRPVSPASAPEEPEDVPAVASAPGPGPELEPHEPLGTGPGAPAGMALGLAEPGADPEPTRPCAMSPWDIPGVVSGPELEPHEPSGPGPMAPARMALGLAEPEVDLEPTRPCAMSPWDIPGVVSGPELEPHEPSSPGPVAPAGMALGLEEPEADPEPTSPCAWSTWDEPGEEEPTILAFPPSLVAEQLTLMCAELYGRIEFGECKTYLESQPLMEGIELLAPNIHNIMRQFDATFYFVTSSCLGAPSLMAQDRARVVEFWIQVAKECLDLKNFESLHAILCALGSSAVCRLESTWGHVSWKSFWSYKKLQKRDQGLNGKQLLKEARATVRRRRQAPYGYLDRKAQGIVPFLGYFLRDVPMDQLSEYNADVSDPARHRKGRMVTLIGREIMMHKRVAALYDLEPDERFLSFFQTVEPLDEEKSYRLSCQLEASGQWARIKGLLQFFRSHEI